ncbi:hypothetical protein [Rhizobium aegyptiacum]|uniref:hypothetical protein n=1 Tax=Rhizobium aegyptiacum TaxID=1764550 RepID=UPI001FD92884|nr:hypothetical protein [Rhizobium aegyptiacum]
MAIEECSPASGEGPQRNKPAATRLYAILARTARTGVIFRRGPSKQVQLIRWDLGSDTFEHGQWLKGRIYERRCDLSPSGRLLVYFAATNRAPYGTWTAISKPPFLTALALWPKGDAWGGGGIFEDEETLLLNHSPEWEASFKLADGFRLKPGMRVKLCGKRPGRGEDEPINGLLRERNGWRVIEIGEEQFCGLSGTAVFRFSKPHVEEKVDSNGRRLQMMLHTIGRRQKAWYGLDYRVIDRHGSLLIDLPDSDWADWDGGDLVFARAGCIYRLRESQFGHYADKRQDALQRLYDFSNARFTAVAPTRAALQY